MFTLSEAARRWAADVPVGCVAELVWWALCRSRQFDPDRDELQVVSRHRGEAAALVQVMTDVRVEEWTGSDGRVYRDYIGRMRCGLRLRVNTDAVMPHLAGGGR